jgi:bla regulator protein BlaR1
MKRVFGFAACVLMTLTVTIAADRWKARAQTHNGGASALLPTFALASIRPVNFGPGHHSIHVKFTPDGLLDEGVPFNIILRGAFGIADDRIFGLPDWARREPYYIEAKVDPSDGLQFTKLTKEQKYAMVLVLFEDRLGLKFHHETREGRLYTLVTAKGGPKLKKSSPAELGKDGTTPPMKVSGSKGGLHVEQDGASMASVVDLVSKILHSSVIDKTGLTDRYDFVLDYLPEVAELALTTQGSEQAPDIFVALEEQLGLKLESGKGLEDVIVIDRIEHPSPN